MTELFTGHFEIPCPYKWDKSFEVMYDLLDEEHQELFDALCKLSETNTDEAFSECVKVFEKHFYDEEAMMYKKGYGGAPGHAKTHDYFLEIMRTWVLPVKQNRYNWAKGWLVYHIKGLDFNYKGKL